jgi:hypothetical protein
MAQQKPKHRPGRRPIDWDPIEVEYRMGRLTLAALEAKYGVSATNISRHMRKHGIVRDLTDSVRLATRAKIIEREYNRRLESATGFAKNAVEAAAEVVADVVERHKSSMLQLREIWTTLVSELMSLSVAKRKGLTRERLIQIGADAGLDEEEVRAAIEAATMQARIGAVDKLANVLAKLVPLERKTYGLDEDGAENEWETKWRLLAEQYDTELAQSTQAS